LALPENIRIGWRGFPGTNTLADYKNPLITGVKSFMVQALGERNGEKIFLALPLNS
jgi:hypothetical protein